MANSTYFNHLILAVALIALSTTLTWLMLNVRILDIPNHRSSHERPVPSSGGLSIVVTAYVGILAVYLSDDIFRSIEWQAMGVGIATMIVALAGLLDDLGYLRTFKTKLSAQVAACCLLLGFGVVIEHLTVPFWGRLNLGVWGYPVTAIWVLGLTNIFNFMDGLDGLAAGTALLVSFGFALIALSQDAVFSHIFCYILFAATVGFFAFNFPRARIFMGDVGSQFMGFAFAALAVLAAEYDAAGISILIMPLFFLHFIFDTIFTFCRRLLAGEDVTQAHKGHLYQLMNQLGFSHPQVSSTQFAMVLLQGGGAIALTSGVVSEPALVILPLFVIQAVYAFLVISASRRRGLT